MKAIFHIDKTDNHDCSLSVEGDLTVQSGEEFKLKLIALLDHSENGNGTVEISLRDATAIDVSAIQLLYAVTEILSKSKGDFSVVWPENEDVAALIARTGFKRLLKF